MWPARTAPNPPRPAPPRRCPRRRGRRLPRRRGISASPGCDGERARAAGQHAGGVSLAKLLVDGRPLLPRIVQYQGEPLEVLARLGFNAVWLSQPAPAELLAEAERTQMWIICPPPDTEDLHNRRAEINGAYNRVLVWDLGRELFTEQLDATRRAAENMAA